MLAEVFGLVSILIIFKNQGAINSVNLMEGIDHRLPDENDQFLPFPRKDMISFFQLKTYFLINQQLLI